MWWIWQLEKMPETFHQPRQIHDFHTKLIKLGNPNIFVELIDFADVFLFPHQEDSALVADIIPVSIGREMAVKVGDRLEAGRHLLEWHALETYMGVSKNRGTPKWMVYNGKPY